MFCRFCGKTVFDDSVFCSYCGKQLIARIDNESTNFDFSSLDGALNADKEYQAKLNKARAFARTNKYQQAMEIYTKMIDDDPTDLNGYIGCIRVASKNFTDIGGYFYFRTPDNTTSSYFTSAAIETFKKLLNGASISDKECEEFIKKYDEHLKQQEKARLEQERSRLELEKKRQAEREEQEEKRRKELEEKQRKEEEEQKRKPQDLKDALLVGDEAIRQNNRETAYKAYIIAIRLANELGAEMPTGFIENLSKACEIYVHDAKNNQYLSDYLNPIAAKGNVTAQCLLGRIHYLGGNHSEGLKWYRPLANNGVAEGLYYVGLSVESETCKLHYDDRDGAKAKEIYLQAYFWYKQAYDKNYLPAVEKVAFYHRYGRGVQKNIPFALELYKRLNKHYEVAMIYQYEIRNLNEAIYWYKRANKNFEVAEAYEKLGNKNEAIEYYKKCICGNDYNSDRAQKAVARLLYGN